MNIITDSTGEISMMPNTTKDKCNCSTDLLKLTQRIELIEKKIEMLCDSMHVEFRDGLHLVEKEWE